MFADKASLNIVRIGSDITFSSLKIPLACVATDIITGEEVVIKQGSVLEGIRASISLILKGPPSIAESLPKGVVVVIWHSIVVGAI